MPPDASSGDPAPVTKAKNGRGGFFAVDRRAWHLVTSLGLNESIAYLIMARGTGGDNRTTKWSANAVGKYTRIARSRRYAAIQGLERAGAVWRDPTSKRDHPRYKLVPAHEIRGCEGAPPPALKSSHAQLVAALGSGWTEVPKSASASGAYSRWGVLSPRKEAEELVKLGHVIAHSDGRYFRTMLYDAEAAARPDWIWLPNALVDGAADETAPVELMHQAADPLALRLLVNLYGSQTLDEDGGISFRRMRQEYTRHQVGQRGALVAWGFAPTHTSPTVFANAPFVACHIAKAIDQVASDAGWKEFWGCLNILRTTGLVEFVTHLVTQDNSQGEIIHPVALPGTGLKVEQELGRAAIEAAIALTTDLQVKWACDQGMVMFAPLPEHMKHVQMFGIARLRYRPRTNRTMAFFAREEEWQQELARLREMIGNTSTEAPTCNIKG